jgi:hypothetical protein
MIFLEILITGSLIVLINFNSGQLPLFGAMIWKMQEEGAVES